MLYVCSILDDLGLYVEDATPMYIDNSGARQMANAQKPTCKNKTPWYSLFCLYGIDGKRLDSFETDFDIW